MNPILLITVLLLLLGGIPTGGYGYGGGGIGIIGVILIILLVLFLLGRL